MADDSREDPARRHDAFISYSRTDVEFARALEAALEGYRPPRGLGLPDRRLEVFRDERDLTGSDYFRSIETHLESAAKLIVVCSPDARWSRYVDDEIRRFARLRGAHNVVPVLLSGVPNNEADETPDRKAFPDALCEVLELPLAVAYRGFRTGKDRIARGRFEGAWYSILANLYELDRDVLEQRDRVRRIRQRRVRTAIAGAVMVALALLAAVAWWQKVEADRQRHAAEMRLADSLWESARRERAQGNLPLALHLMAQAVEAAPEADLARTIMLDAAPDAESVVLVKALQHEDLGMMQVLACGDRTHVVAATEESRAGGEPSVTRIRLVDADTGEQAGHSFALALAESAVPLGLEADCGPRRLLLRTLDSTEELGGSVQLFDFESGERHHRELEPGTYAAAHSPDLERFVRRAGDALSVEEVKSGSGLGAIRVADALWISFSMDGSLVLTLDRRDVVRLWNAETGEEIGDGFRQEGGVGGAALAPNNRWLLTWGLRMPQALLWDTRQPGEEARRLPGPDRLRGARFSGDGRRILIWDRGREARLLSTDRIEDPGVALLHSALDRDPVFSPDGRFVLTSTREDQAILWDADTGERRATLYVPDSQPFFTAGGLRILTLARNGGRWWDAGALRRRNVRLRPNGVLEQVRVSAERDRLLTVSSLGGPWVQLWDLETGAQLGEFGDRTARWRQALFAGTQDRSVLWPASPGAGSGAALWDVNEPRLVASLAHDAPVAGAALSPNRELTLTWSEDGVARAWDVSTGDRVGVDLIHDEPIRGGIVWSGRALIWEGDRDGPARLWDLRTGRPVAPSSTARTWQGRCSLRKRASSSAGATPGRPGCGAPPTARPSARPWSIAHRSEAPPGDRTRRSS